MLFLHPQNEGFLSRTFKNSLKQKMAGLRNSIRLVKKRINHVDASTSAEYIIYIHLTRMAVARATDSSKAIECRRRPSAALREGDADGCVGATVGAAVVFAFAVVFGAIVVESTAAAAVVAESLVLQPPSRLFIRWSTAC